MNEIENNGSGATQTMEQSSEPAVSEAALLPEHKNQLRQRVEARMGEMIEALAQLAKDTEHEQRVRQQAAGHPYRTVGVAALAGLVLSNRSARAVAGWAGLRLGWSVLQGVLGDGDQRPAERLG